MESTEIQKYKSAMKSKKIIETELCEDNHSARLLCMIRPLKSLVRRETISSRLAGKRSESQKNYGCSQVPFTTGLRIATCTITPV